MQTVDKPRLEIITHHGRARKWNVVPPAISIVGRAVCVRTKTGQWKGGHLIRSSDPIFGQTD